MKRKYKTIECKSIRHNDCGNNNAECHCFCHEIDEKTLKRLEMGFKRVMKEYGETLRLLGKKDETN